MRNLTQLVSPFLANTDKVLCMPDVKVALPTLCIPLLESSTNLNAPKGLSALGEANPLTTLEPVLVQ